MFQKWEIIENKLLFFINGTYDKCQYIWHEKLKMLLHQPISVQYGSQEQQWKSKSVYFFVPNVKVIS